MIPQKEFYFLRHGQTDYNLNQIKSDHPPHLSLNETGRRQALEIEPVIARLPIQALCYSPMLRAVQTKEIVASRLTVPQFEIPDLGECSAHVWHHMSLPLDRTQKNSDEFVARFMERVLRGLLSALSNDAPVLIVAHGGIHRALCTLLDIKDHPWLIDNCVPCHFLPENGKWQATKI